MRNLRLILGVILTMFLLGGGYLAATYLPFALTSNQPGSKQSLLIEVTKKELPPEISRHLAQMGAVSDGRKLLWLGKLLRKWKSIKAGEYEVSSGMTPLEILGVISSGISVKHPVTIKEGDNLFQVGDAIQAKGLAPKARFVALCRDPRFIASLHLATPPPPSLEGYLFPDTYYFNRSQTLEEMVHQMVRRFASEWTDADELRAKALGLTRHQVITLASIIEKETGASEERPIISSVFHNRLQKRMRLQSDPTTIYGMWERFDGNLHKNDLLDPSPYNTYYISALPVGPISNPGKEAIEAALNPAQSDYFFFVSHNNGTHEFSATYENHNRAVARFQKDPKARQGKSWRDHLKQKKPVLSSPSG